MNTIWNLFFIFLKIGLFSIGGGYAIIPLIQEKVVNQTGWISEKMFTDIITISQMTPGPLAVNTSTFVGLQIGGFWGAVAATLGCVLCGVVISLFLYNFFQKHQNSTYIFEILNGLKSASLGLIISAATTIIILALFGTNKVYFNSIFEMLNWTALIIFFVTLLIVRKWKINPIVIIIISGILGIFFYL
ncbi:chromate transporter [Clostridioides difficile]|uniref:chromate transporter n=1 Tax=Clostridioides difficile TaxID=1496 RepID=UPI0021C3D5DA|nr:chromate transporter [Clostridioides difficile]UUC42529.1 chromate transporter [Clostridioides difficile]